MPEGGKSKILLAIAALLNVSLADLRGLDRLTIVELQSLYDAILRLAKK